MSFSSIIRTVASILALLTLLQLSETNQARSPKNLLRKFHQKCSQKEVIDKNIFGPTLNATQASSHIVGDECEREPTAWRWRYIDEIKPRAGILIQEKTIDARLANIIYTIESAKIFYNDPFKFDSGDANLDAQNEQLVAGGAQIDDQLCGRHLNEMLALMEDLRLKNKRGDKLDERHIRLARVLDSFGRFESGFLYGKSHSVGSYSQCRDMQLVFNLSGSAPAIDTRFCWAKMSINKHLDKSLREREVKVDMQDAVISAGICIPNTCHTRHLKQYRQLFERIVQSQFKLPESMYVDEHLDLQSIFCTVDETSELRFPLAGKMFFTFLALWFSLIAYNSIGNYRQQGQLSAAKCFNLIDCYSDFVGSNKKSTYSGRVDLSTLNLIKVLACAYVVFGHTSMVHFFYADDQLKPLWRIPNDPFYTAILVGVLAVDTFFVISGLLMTILLLSKLKKLELAGLLPTKADGILRNLTFYGKTFLSIFSLRYLKMAPVYFLIFWFAKSVFPFVGSGPFWDYGFNKQTAIGACQQESWFTPLTMSSSYLPLFKQCLTPSWSISIDLLLCLVVIPLILLSYKAPKTACLLSVLMSCFTINRTVEALDGFEPALRYELKENNVQGIGQFFNKYSLAYTLPHYRLSSMLLGCAAGYFLFKYNQNEYKQWPRWFSYLVTSTALSFQIILFFVLANVHLLKDFIPRAIFRQVFPSFVYLRVLWCAANSVIFVRMASDWQNTALVNLGKSNYLKIFSKLNYAILLIHWNYILFDVHYRDAIYYLSKWHFIKSSGAVYLFTLVIGIFVHITIETPLDRLIRRYILREKLVTSSNEKDNSIITESNEKEEATSCQVQGSKIEATLADAKKVQ